MDNKGNKIFDHDRHINDKEYINSLRDTSEIVNDDKYNVEVSQDFTIPTISSQYVDINQSITGYTAGLITRDLVSLGESMLKDKEKNINEQKK